MLVEQISIVGTHAHTPESYMAVKATFDTVTIQL